MAIYFKYVCIAVNTKSSYTFVGVCYYWAQWLAMVCRWQYTSSMYVNCQREIFSHFCWSVLLLGTMVGYGMQMAIYFKYVCIAVNMKSSYTFVGVCYYWAQWLAMVCRWQYTSSMYV